MCSGHVAHSVFSHGCVVQNIGFDSFIDDLSTVDRKRRLRERLQMTGALGISLFNSGVSRGCLVDRCWKVVGIERAAVRGSRHGGYRCNCVERCTAKSQMKALATNLRGSCGLHLPRQRPKSVLQFESDRVFDQHTSEVVSQNAGCKPRNVFRGGCV